MKELRLAFDLLRMNTWRVILAIVVGSLTLLRWGWLVYQPGLLPAHGRSLWWLPLPSL